MANLMDSQGSTGIDVKSDSSERDRQVEAARRLVQVLELAEALPFTPKRHLDLPNGSHAREPGGPS